MTSNNEEVWKCPTCGTETQADSFGYNPPVPECPKCNHMCNWECPEAERRGFTTKEFEGYQKGWLACEKQNKETIEAKRKELKERLCNKEFFCKTSHRDNGKFFCRFCRKIDAVLDGGGESDSMG